MGTYSGGVLDPLEDQPPIIRYSGIFDFDKLYKNMVDWFKDKDYDFYEKNYKFKPVVHGKEIEIEWEAEKKVTEYYLFEIDVSFHFWDFQTVEVIENGKKKKLTKARMQIIIKGAYRLDYTGRWGNTPFNEWLRGFFHKYIIKRKIMFLMWNTLYYEVYKLHALVKDQIDAQTNYNAY
jgi:hypothetical protein